MSYSVTLTPLPLPNDFLPHAPLIETDACNEAYQTLNLLANPYAGIKPLFGVLVGGMGIGKTFAACTGAKKLASELGSTAVMHVYMDKFEAYRSTAEPTINEHLVLALLAGCLPGLDLDFVSTLMKKQASDALNYIHNDLKVSNVVMVLDEFQRNPKATLKILKACGLILQSPGAPMRVFPILAGICPLDRKETSDILHTSGCSVKDIWVEPFTWQQTLTYSSSMLNVTPAQLDNTRHVKVIISDCGGVPRVLAIVSTQLSKTDPNNWQLATTSVGGRDIKDIATASIIYEKMVDEVGQIHGEGRWTNLVRRDGEKYANVPRATQLVRRLALAALSGLQIPSFDDEIIPGVTFQKCLESGLMNKTKHGSSIIISPIAIASMAKLFKDAIPREADILNPFNQDYATFERLSMATIYIRLATVREFHPGGPEDVECWMELKQLRADVEHYFAPGEENQTVDVRVPTRSALESLIVMENETKGFGLDDGVLTLECKVNGQVCVLRWLLQSPNTGVVADITNSDVMDLIIGPMEKQIGATTNDYIVLDVFNDRIGPKQPDTCGKQIVANKRKCIKVTRGDNFDAVVGEVLAGRKRLRGMWE